jgi:cyanophycinase
MGALLLEGGAEFGGDMREPDLKAIELAGGREAPIRIIPTAAAPDQNDQRAGKNGIRWFQQLGGRDVLSIPLVDRDSANDERIAQSLQDAKLIYMLGGFTHYLGQTLHGSRAWQAVLEVYHQKGAVIAGSSAGAMVMCERYYDPGQGQIHEGLNLVKNSLVLPHHDTFGKNWAPQLMSSIPEVTLIGIDEQTGMIQAGDNPWTVYGKGSVTLYTGGGKTIFKRGETFSL